MSVTDVAELGAMRDRQARQIAAYVCSEFPVPEGLADEYRETVLRLSHAQLLALAGE